MTLTILQYVAITAPHEMVRLERMYVGLQKCQTTEVLDYRGLGLQRCRLQRFVVCAVNPP